MFEFNFTSKSEYLQQKAAWFQAYKAQVFSIRAAKAGIKQAQRENRVDTYKYYLELAKRREDMKKLIEIRQKSRKDSYLQMINAVTS